MTPEPALRAAVAATPDDDTPRLALADYLDEHGRPDEACEQRLAVAMRRVCAVPADDGPRLEYAAVCLSYGRPERAEFIRVQCEQPGLLAAGDPGCDCPGRRDEPCRQTLWVNRVNGLRRREQLLLAHNHRGWFPPPAGYTPGIDGRPGFGTRLIWNSAARHPDHPHRSAGGIDADVSRGFVSTLTCTAADWLILADQIAWRPGWEAACGTCRGSGVYHGDGTSSKPFGDDWGCPDCGGRNRYPGTGRVPRDAPPATAQPIETVTLTTLPALCDHSGDRAEVGPAEAFAYLTRRWPGIRFVLPTTLPG